jgi:hypothetical protein
VKRAKFVATGVAMLIAIGLWLNNRNSRQRTITVDQYRSLDALKATPVEGSAWSTHQVYQVTQTIIAGLTFLVVLAYTIATFEQLRAAKDTLVATERPWISISNIAITDPFLFDTTSDGGMVASLHLTFTLKNSGQSPALYAWIEISMHDAGGSRLSIADEERKVCDPDRRRTSAYGLLVPPQGTTTERTVASLSQLELAKAHIAQNGSPYVTPVVIGCVDYRFPWDAVVHHQTPFAFGVFQKWQGLERNIVVQFKSIRTEIPPDDLWLDKDAFSGPGLGGIPPAD